MNWKKNKNKEEEEEEDKEDRHDCKVIQDWNIFKKINKEDTQYNAPINNLDILC